MPFRIKNLFAALSLASFFLGASAATRAEVISFSTQGVFSCQSVAQCSGGGTSVTLGSGGNTLTLTFVGVSTSLDTQNVNPNGGFNTSFGSIQTSVTGSGFALPSNVLGGLDQLLRFTVTVTQSAPHPGSGSVTGHIIGTISQDASTGVFTVGAPFDRTYVALPGFGPNLPFVVYEFDTSYNLVPPGVNGGVTDIQGRVGAVPEPATVILLGTGLLGAYAGSRRRRRSRR